MNQEITVKLDAEGRVVAVYESDSKRRCEFHVLDMRELGRVEPELPPPDALNDADAQAVSEFLRDAGPEYRKRVRAQSGEQWPTDWGEVEGDEA